MRGRFPAAIALTLLLAAAACGEPEPSAPASPVPVTPTAVAAATAMPTTPVAPTATPASPTARPTTVPAPIATPLSARVPTPPPEGTPEPTPSPTPTNTPEPTPSPTPAAEATPQTLLPTPTSEPNTPTPTPTPTATPPTATPTSLPTLEPTPTAVLATGTNGTTPLAEGVSQSQPTATSTPTTVEVVKILRPSVVHIATLSVALGIFNQPSVAEGVGTGIVLDLEGHILTNNHVVENAQEIIVTLGTSESFNAQVVGLDPITDTAVIRIEATDLTPATLGDSSALEVGEDVIAIGHALGLRGGPTVSKGVVSALGRAIETDPETQFTIVDLIQTDASINPGNSGGPLVNSRAEVIGMNTAIVQQGQGIGFAININDAMVVAAQLIEKGTVTRGFLGVRLLNITPFIAKRNNLPVNEGIFIQLVHADTAAGAAGLQVGDIIVQLGETPIANAGELARFLIDHGPGETIDVHYFRGETRVTVEITLGSPLP